MIQYILILLCSNAPLDSLMQETSSAKKSYTNQVLINGILGMSLGIGTGIFYTIGNKAYDEYKDSKTMQSAIKNWDRVRLFDNIRNVCALGALVFTVRAVYYQLKNIRLSKSQSVTPVINFNCTHSKIWAIGLEKRL